MRLAQAFSGVVVAAAVAQAQSSDAKLAYSPPKYPSPWADGSGNWEAAYAKAQAFVKQLTLLEKVNITTGVGWEGEQCVGNTGSVPRLGFPGFCNQDSPLGVRDTDYNSAFPAGGTVAASWDRSLWRQRGADMGAEHRDKGVDTQLGPVVGPLGRSPEGGRGWEGFSPDPVLSGIAVGETVQGIQSSGVIACTKHFILNEQEHFRQVGEANGYGFPITEALSSNIDDVTLHELYLWPFADAVRAGTGAIMCSYNQVNNSYACANSYTLNYLLKGELGFQGFVMSDWQAQHSGVASAYAGLDMTMPGDTLFDTNRTYWGTNLTIAVVNGTVPEWRIDDMVTRIMSAYYYVGRDKHTKPVNFDSWTLDTFGPKHFIANEEFTVINEHVDVRAEHAKNIRDAASKSIVLLKNKGGLPLTGKEKYTGVFGQGAVTNLWGPNGCGDRQCDNGTLAMGWGSGTANFPYLVDPLTAIQNTVLETSGGVIQSVADNWAYAQIAQVASQASVSVVFVSADSGEGYLDIDGNEGDRNNLTLWHDADALIQNVTAVCNNTIVVMSTVGAVLVNSFYQNPNVTAILWAGLPGEQAGNSIADVLYGRVNPGGKLPFSIAKSRSDYGTDVMYEPNNGHGAPQDDFTEGIFIDYRAIDKKGVDPVYEFGYGISYTTFSYSNLQIKSHPVKPYTPTSGHTKPAPSFGKVSKDYSDYVFPASFHQVPYYIYPWLNSSDPKVASEDPDYDSGHKWPAHAADGSAQPKNPAGGAPGGNPQLYDVLFTVSATITNTGKITGDEVVELYISLGGPNDPKVVLRNFDKITLAPNEKKTVSLDVTRRDLSNWDTKTQNWVISKYQKTVYVGASSRKLHLKGALHVSSGSGYGQ
ncbi:beta-glucosidase [Rhizodiscina lignyota]|uniref:beta-glucosidase n=1 Tax=Rhizodiscina lignyota TaxID=1504668 RepID=A0A9P4IGZ2_9PEZI|nr:beta-glucosidase [Rhizodiscina lignyota]